jgi:hypothetical protein
VAIKERRPVVKSRRKGIHRKAGNKLTTGEMSHNTVTAEMGGQENPPTGPTVISRPTIKRVKMATVAIIFFSMCLFPFQNGLSLDVNLA